MIHLLRQTRCEHLSYLFFSLLIATTFLF